MRHRDMPQLLRTLTTAAEPAVEPDPPPEPAPPAEARESRYGGADEDVIFEPPSS